MKAATLPLTAALAMVLILSGCGAPAKPQLTEYAQWSQGPCAEADYFPIAVWLQDPSDAPKYKDAGINLYVGLWQGPTAEQLDLLEEAGMPVICEQNEYALENLDNPVIVAWMHGDEPDNAQAWPKDSGKTGYGPPVEPATVIANYEKVKAADPSRPVLLNLGRSVAVENWPGRGVRTGCSEDYYEYTKASDIVSFDVYPVSASEPEVAGNLWYVPLGVDRLHKYSNNEKIVWNCIEASPIGEGKPVPTGRQIKAEVWMSIIHGSKGLVYFVHFFGKPFNHNYLLDDQTMLADVTAINAQVQGLASAINAAATDAVSVGSSNDDVPIDMLAKQLGDDLYVFAVAARDAATTGAFMIEGLGDATIEVIDEGRQIEVADGIFTDGFDGYQVHLYKISK